MYIHTSTSYTYYNKSWIHSRRPTPTWRHNEIVTNIKKQISTPLISDHPERPTITLGWSLEHPLGILGNNTLFVDLMVSRVETFQNCKQYLTTIISPPTHTIATPVRHIFSGGAYRSALWGPHHISFRGLRSGGGGW